jgi:PAS domain S-box-containing protein
MARSSGTEGRSATGDGESVYAELEFPTISTPDLGLLQSFLALMPDAAVVVDAGGLIVSANEQALSLFGYAFDDLVGRRVESLLPERFRHHHRQYRTDYTRSPQTRPMGAGQDLTGRRKDGGEFPVDISLAPLSVGEGTLIVAAIRDATERRAATSAMAHLAAIVESSTDAIASMTVDGIVTSWNPGAVRVFGFTRAEIMGRHLSILAPEEGSAEFEHLLAIALEGQRSTPLDTRWRKRDGELLDVELSVSPVHDARDQLLGFSAVLRDITERKLVEDELRRLLEWERQRERQHAATSEIRLALLSGRPMSEVLGLISRRAVDLLHAQSSAVTLTQSDQLRVLAASGAGGYLVGTALSMKDSLAGRVVTTGDSIRTESLDAEADLDLQQLQSIPTGPVVGAPVVFEGIVRGALTVLRAPGSPAFTA